MHPKMPESAEQGGTHRHTHKHSTPRHPFITHARPSNPTLILCVLPSDRIGDELAGEPFPCRVLSGRILSAENHPSNNTMYVVSVDVGNKKKRQVVSSLAKAYPDKADLIGLNVALVCNVRPSKVDGVPSEALMLHAASAGSEQLFTLSESKAGTKIIPKGCPVVDSSTFNHQANWDGLEMKTNAEGELVFGKSNAVLFAGKEAVVAAGCGADALVHL